MGQRSDRQRNKRETDRTRPSPPPVEEETDPRLERAWSQLEAGQLEEARQLTDELLELDPESPEAYTLDGAVKAALGEYEAALAAYDRASALDPEYVDPLLDAAELAIEIEDPEAALELCERALDVAEEEEDYLDALLMKAQAHLVDGDPDAARKVLRELPPVDLPTPQHHLLAGASFFELGDLTEANRHLVAADARDPDNADILHAIGMVAEQRGDRKRQIDSWQRVLELDRDKGASPLALDPDRFEAVVKDVMAELPAGARTLLGDVPVVVRDVPSKEMIADGLDPRLLGLFAGTPLPEQSSVGGAPHLECITLFQRNLEREAASLEELIDEIRTTVLHETGHFFGLEEDDLAELGLD